MTMMKLAAPAACALLTLAAATANAATIADENFEAGASGWSDNTTEDPGTTAGGISRHLGRHGQAAAVSKTFALSGTQTALTVAFDFYRFDTWDGEFFRTTLSDNLGNTQVFDTGPNYYYDGPANYAYLAAYTDRNTRLSYAFDTAATSFTLTFSSSLDQNYQDESWGVDNLLITDNSFVTPGGIPEPSAWALLILGFGATGAGMRHRSRSSGVTARRAFSRGI